MLICYNLVSSSIYILNHCSINIFKKWDFLIGFAILIYITKFRYEQRIFYSSKFNPPYALEFRYEAFRYNRI